MRSDSGTDVGFDESWSWCSGRTHGCQWVASLMERFLQNPGTSSAHIDVGQIRCVLDDVFMIILIKLWRKKRCNTHRNWSKQLQKRS